MFPQPYSSTQDGLGTVPVPAPSGFGTTRNGRAPESNYVWLLRRNWWRILVVIALSVAGTYGITRWITPVYQAESTLDIDVRALTGGPGSQPGAVSALDGDQFMETQVVLIQSDDILRPVVNEFNLLHLEKQDSGGRITNRAAAVQAPLVLRGLEVRRRPKTFLIQISYRSPDPVLSARVANAVANSYVNRTLDLQAQRQEAYSRAMEMQIEQTKESMQKSRDRLIQFEQDPHFIDPDQKLAVLSSLLSQAERDSSESETERARKEAALEVLKSGSLDGVEKLAPNASLGEITDKLREATERFDSVKTEYGKNHPIYKKAASDVQRLQADFDKARAGIVSRTETEFRQARVRAALSSQSLARLKKELDFQNSRSVEYRVLKREAEEDRKRFDELELKIQEARLHASVRNDSVRLADAARPPLKPISPDLRLNLILAACLSPLFAIFAVILVDKGNRTVKNPQSAWSGDLNLPVLGNLPLFPLAKQSDPLARFLHEEAVLSLHSTVMLAPEFSQVRSLVVTSAVPGEGKTATACQLAKANARRHRKTLLIDCDFRRPAVHARCGISPVRGMESVLEGTARWQELIRPMPGLPDLDVLPVGMNGARGVEFLRSRLAGVVKEVSAIYDLVVIDSPPMLGLSDALEVAGAADGVLLLAVPGESDSRNVARCVSLLRQVGVRNLGLVMNKVSSKNSPYAIHEDYGKYCGRYLTGITEKDQGRGP
jgi:capsular exopolysaccharide synthesis family protein